jgi:hypothetical protein
MKFAVPLVVFLSSFTSLIAAPESGLDRLGGLRPVIAPAASAFAYARLESGVQFRVNGVTKNVLFYGPETIRVNANLGENRWEQPSLVVLGGPAKVSFAVEESADSLALASAAFRVVVDKRSGALAFYDAQGKLFTRRRSRRASLREPIPTRSKTPSRSSPTRRSTASATSDRRRRTVAARNCSWCRPTSASSSP